MRESHIEIDRKRLEHNLKTIKSRLHPDTKILANLKANAYGLGAFEIGKYLEKQAIDYFSVAYINEAVALRQKGIRTKLLVFNPSFKYFDELITYHLEPEVSSLAYLKELIAYLSQHQITKFPVHLKLDTGMHRAGIMPEELDDLTQILKQTNSVSVKSVFSHLAAAEDPSEDIFTQSQIQTFDRMSRRLSKNIADNFFRHLLNTAGIFRFPEAHFDMARPGLGLFGYNLVNQHKDDLLPIARLITKINQVKKLAAGNTVGYNRRFKAQQDSRVGLLPLGYADGIDRRLGYQKFYVKCRGYKVPVVGTISMDTMSIDLTGTPCEQGDEVVVFDYESVYEIARQLDTIPYEIIARLSRRLPRKMV